MSAYVEGLGDDAAADRPVGLLPLSPEVVGDELGSAIRLLQKHQRRMHEVSTRGGGEDLGAFVVEAVGELLYTAAKLESLARILNGEGSRG